MGVSQGCDWVVTVKHCESWTEQHLASAAAHKTEQLNSHCSPDWKKLMRNVALFAKAHLSTHIEKQQLD